MEEYQIQDNEDTLIETDYEASEIYEGSLDSSNIEVIDVGAFPQNQLEYYSEIKFSQKAAPKDQTKRKYSFVWQYFKPVQGTHQFQCLLCQSCVGGQTSNLARHLSSTHDINKKRDNPQDFSKMDDETIQATASLSNTTTYEEDHNGGRSSVDITSSERKERRGASYVWSYVDKLSRHTIRCKLCTKVMSFHGTANVITHLQRRHNVLGEPGSQLNQMVNAKTESLIEINVPKCNMCESLFETKDIETIVKHLVMVHSVETNQNVNGDSKFVIRPRKRNRHNDFETDDEDDYDTKWSKLDDTVDQNLPTHFDENNIKKDDSLYDDIIEEDPHNYDEEPFDPNDMPLANPLSPHSSHAESPHQPATTIQYQNFQQQQVLQPNSLLPPLESKVLLKLQEDRLRMETDYFREKAGFYRMQKYLTALQAKKYELN
ncbi:hypothetical protein EVAR_100546_1 [Eumeta japonica]|uniref:BED-type domain-containing protein n=1 Tax=Eumeta variegata TaxID=151549 RepID=A0A4C1ZP04_EUMVA|nr:hypothetical protein EVAR_100546_1 [Eumeta japonica]